MKNVIVPCFRVSCFSGGVVKRWLVSSPARGFLIGGSRSLMVLSALSKHCDGLFFGRCIYRFPGAIVGQLREMGFSFKIKIMWDEVGSSAHVHVIFNTQNVRVPFSGGLDTLVDVEHVVKSSSSLTVPAD